MGLYSFQLIVLVLFWDNRWILSGFDYNFILLQKINYALLFTGIITFWKFSYELTNYAWVDKVARAITGALLTLVFVTLFFPENVHSLTFWYLFAPAVSASSIFKLWIFARHAWYKQNLTSHLHLAGYIFVTFTAVNDLLFFTGLIKTGVLLDAGCVVFLLIRTYLSYRYSAQREQELVRLKNELTLENKAHLEQLNTALAAKTELIEARNALDQSKSRLATIMKLFVAEIEMPAIAVRDILSVLAEREDQLSNSMYRAVYSGYQAAEQLESQIKGISRITSNDFQNLDQDVAFVIEPKSFLERAFEYKASDLAAKGIHVSFSYEFPYQDESYYECDSYSLLKLIEALTENMLLSGRGVHIHIVASVKSSSKGMNLQLNIHHTAMTITNELRVSLNNYFNRLDDKLYLGSGMVLLGQIRGYLEELNGRLVINETNAEDTTLVLEVPVHESFKDDSVKSDFSRINSAKILFIEDSPTTFRSYIELLREFGVTVDEARSYENAIVHFSDTDYDLVIIDHYIAGVTGIEIAKEIRRMENGKDAAPTNIRILTSEIPDSRFDFSGVDGFIEKPYSIETLLSLVGDSKEPKRESYAYDI